MWTRVNPECMFFKNFRGILFKNGKRYAKSETTIQKALEERIPNHILHVQFKRKTSVSQSNLLYPLYVYNYPKQQKMPKRVKMFTSKWHRKQRHFFIHPFTSLQCIWFVGRKLFVENKLTRAYLKWGKGGGGLWIFNYSPFWGPLAIWLDQTGTCTTWLWGLQYKTIIGSLWYLATEEMQ